MPLESRFCFKSVVVADGNIILLLKVLADMFPLVKRERGSFNEFPDLLFITKPDASL